MSNDYWDSRRGWCCKLCQRNCWDCECVRPVEPVQALEPQLGEALGVNGELWTAEEILRQEG